MISYDQYRYLDDALKYKPTVRPQIAAYSLEDGHTPTHAQCQITAMHLESSRGWRAQIGIQWLDKGGLIVPWPHVVNWVEDRLMDFSSPILERKLAFTLIGNDVEMANGLTASVDDPEGFGRADPMLHKLNESWRSKLYQFCLSEESLFDPFRPA